MPEFNAELFIPFQPLHWTSIVHYVIIAGTLYILVASQSDVSIPFLILISVLALSTAASLYSNKLPVLPPFIIFLFRILVVGLPFTIAGIAKQEDLRGIGVVLGVLGILLLVSAILVCTPLLGDPRLKQWCVSPPV